MACHMTARTTINNIDIIIHVAELPRTPESCYTRRIHYSGNRTLYYIRCRNVPFVIIRHIVLAVFVIVVFVVVVFAN